MSIEEKILTIERLCKKFKLSWSICHFAHDARIHIHISPKGWDHKDAFVVKKYGFYKALDETIKQIHNSYLD